MKADASESILDEFFSVYLDTDITSVLPGTVKVVGTRRRERQEMGYGFIHVIWILLSKRRCIASTQPKLQKAVEKLFVDVADSEIIYNRQFHDRLLNVCVRVTHGRYV